MVDGLNTQLPFAKPFDLASTLESGQAHRWRKELDWYIGVVRGNLIKIKQDEWNVLFRSEPNTDESIRSLISNYFRLDEDLEEVYKDINKDPNIATVIERYRGMRILRQEPWECMVAFICSANSNISRIGATMEILAQHFGNPIVLDGITRFSFPSPSQLASVGEIELRRLGLGFRAPYVAYATQAVSEGSLELEPLRHIPYEEAKGKLMEIPGIGPKIADCILIFSLDRLEAFPIDVWVRRALTEWYFEGQMVRDDVLLRWAQGYFGPYAGYAQQYLFHGRRLQK